MRLNLKDERMMVNAFRKGIVLSPFSESLIQNHPKTFAEIRRRAVAHIAAEEEVNKKCTCVVSMCPRATGHPQTLRYRLLLGVVLFATTEVTVPPRLLQVMCAGEGETAGKV